MRKRAAALIIENGFILLIHRVKNQDEYYTLPGGGIEEGESPQQACLRELEEETGLTGEIDTFLGTFSNINNEESYFSMINIKGKLQTGLFEKASDTNHYRAEWIPVDQIRAIHLVPEFLYPMIADQVKRSPSIALA